MSGLLVIFGITGDLSKRYLLPALYHLEQQNLLPQHFEIIGVSRRNLASHDLHQLLVTAVSAGEAKPQAAVLQRLNAKVRLVTMDLTQPEDYFNLKHQLDAIEDEHGTCLNRLFYLSIPPHTYGPIIDMLGQAGLHSGCQHGIADSRVMVEKPFGYDLATAKELITRLHTVFSESQIFRIDHYLAKETAQNILTFRFANPIFNAGWDRHSIKSITITASEAIGIEGRALFYEPVGALRDFVQNHLLQLLVLVTMPEPRTMDSAHIHAEKLKTLQAIKTITPAAVTTSATRGQYQGYRSEVGNDQSITETFARLRLSIAGDDWRGVPLTLQMGKRLDERRTAIAIEFAGHGHNTNTLIFRIQPDEGIVVELLAKTPGLSYATQAVQMDFSYAQAFGAGMQPSAYQRVLMDGIRGDQTLFASSAEILESWRIVDAVTREWAKSGASLITYKPGTSADDIN